MVPGRSSEMPQRRQSLPSCRGSGAAPRVQSAGGDPRTSGNPDVWRRFDPKLAGYGREPGRTTRWAVPKESSLVPGREKGRRHDVPRG